MDVIIVPLAFAAFFTLPVAVVGVYRYATGRGAGNVARIATFTRNALLTAAVILAINEITAPMGYGIAPRDRSAAALVEMYRPGFYLLCGVVTAAFGWGLHRAGRWIERRLSDLLRRQGRERTPVLEEV